jgi:hypothetical protein
MMYRKPIARKSSLSGTVKIIIFILGNLLFIGLIVAASLMRGVS